MVCGANRTVDMVKTRFGVLFNKEAVLFGSLGRRGFRVLAKRVVARVKPFSDMFVETTIHCEALECLIGCLVFPWLVSCGDMCITKPQGKDKRHCKISL